MVECTPFTETIWLVRKLRTALFSLSSARRVVPHAETRFPRAEECLRMRRLVFRVRRTVSACGDSCSACGGPSPHAEIRVPRAEDRLCMRRLVFHVRRTVLASLDPRLPFRVRKGAWGRGYVSACGDRCSACGELSFICILKAGGNGTAATAMAVPVFED